MEKTTLLFALAALLMLLGCTQQATQPQQLTPQQCSQMGGSIVNTLDGGQCGPAYKNAGNVEGLRCPCICCVYKGK